MDKETYIKSVPTVDYDEFGEVINGENTFKYLARILINNGPVLIGWTDGSEEEHRDILFTLMPSNFGENVQNGYKYGIHLFVSILGCGSCAGFLVEHKKDNTKEPSYINEKLGLSGNGTDEKICELINGIIRELDLIWT